ncbi:hypothetical protein JXA85_07770 [Candidatus Woesearchaeota archaeon]|nr:hypothetical protein [Candidatus Woesearchaeota archaeon]
MGKINHEKKSVLIVCDKVEELDELIENLEGCSNVSVACALNVYQAVELLKKQRFNLTYYRHVANEDPSRQEIYDVLPKKNKLQISDITDCFLSAKEIAKLKKKDKNYNLWQSEHAYLGELASLLSLANDKSDKVMAKIISPQVGPMRKVLKKYNLCSVQIEPYELEPMKLYKPLLKMLD